MLWTSLTPITPNDKVNSDHFFPQSNYPTPRCPMHPSTSTCEMIPTCAERISHSNHPEARIMRAAAAWQCGPSIGFPRRGEKPAAAQLSRRRVACARRGFAARANGVARGNEMERIADGYSGTRRACRVGILYWAINFNKLVFDSVVFETDLKGVREIREIVSLLLLKLYLQTQVKWL